MLNPLNGMYGSLIKLGLVVVLLASLYGTHRYKVHEAVKEAVQVVQLQHQSELFRQKELLLEKKQTAETKLQDDFNKRKGEQDAKIKTLTVDRDNLLISLRSRPDRPASVSGNTQSADTTASTTGATGQELFKPDAEFLARFATDTETLKLGLIQCYKDYDAVKEAVESFNKK